MFSKMLATIGVIGTTHALSVHVTHPVDLKTRFSPTGEVPTAMELQGHMEYGESFVGRLSVPTDNT